MPNKKEIGGREGQREGVGRKRGCNIQFESPSKWEAARLQEQKAAHVASAVRTQRKMNSSATCFLLCTQGRTPDHGMVPPTFMCVFSLQLARPRNLKWLGVAPLLVCLVLIVLAKKMF